LHQAFNPSAKAPIRKSRLLAYSALALMVGIGLGIAWRYSGRRSAILQYKLIAVLPFRPISSQPRPELEALSEGMAETATAKLTRLVARKDCRLWQRRTSAESTLTWTLHGEN